MDECGCAINAGLNVTNAICIPSCQHTPNNANCDDGNPCTDDSCDPNFGQERSRFISDTLPSDPCVHTPDETNTCSDGDACDDSGELTSCIALPGNEPPLVSSSGPKEVKKGVFEIPFKVEDPDGDNVVVKATADSGDATISGGVITYTLPRPISKDDLSAGGDQAGSGCALVR